MEGGRVQVVCTPSGGAKSVRLALPQDGNMPDEALVEAIQAALVEAEPQR